VRLLDSRAHVVVEGQRGGPRKNRTVRLASYAANSSHGASRRTDKARSSDWVKSGAVLSSNKHLSPAHANKEMQSVSYTDLSLQAPFHSYSLPQGLRMRSRLTRLPCAFSWNQFTHHGVLRMWHNYRPNSVRYL